MLQSRILWRSVGDRAWRWPGTATNESYSVAHFFFVRKRLVRMQVSASGRVLARQMRWWCENRLECDTGDGRSVEVR